MGFVLIRSEVLFLKVANIWELVDYNEQVLLFEILPTSLIGVKVLFSMLEDLMEMDNGGLSISRI